VSGRNPRPPPPLFSTLCTDIEHVGGVTNASRGERHRMLRTHLLWTFTSLKGALVDFVIALLVVKAAAQPCTQSRRRLSRASLLATLRAPRHQTVVGEGSCNIDWLTINRLSRPSSAPPSSTTMTQVWPTDLPTRSRRRNGQPLPYYPKKVIITVVEKFSAGIHATNILQEDLEIGSWPS
jgi:hypothetical protein